jgi:hypothetical protein
MRFGGIAVSSSICEAAITSKLSLLLPGTTIGPPSPPFITASSESSRNPDFGRSAP